MSRPNRNKNVTPLGDTYDQKPAPNPDPATNIDTPAKEPTYQPADPELHASWLRLSEIGQNFENALMNRPIRKRPDMDVRIVLPEVYETIAAKGPDRRITWRDISRLPGEEEEDLTTFANRKLDEFEAHLSPILDSPDAAPKGGTLTLCYHPRFQLTRADTNAAMLEIEVEFLCGEKTEKTEKTEPTKTPSQG